MKDVKLYPPGGGEPITPHPSKIDEMLNKGWTLEPEKAKAKTTHSKQEIESDG